MLSVYEKNIKIIYKSNQQNDIIEMCIKYSPAERQKLCNRKLWKKIQEWQKEVSPEKSSFLPFRYFSVCQRHSLYDSPDACGRRISVRVENDPFWQTYAKTDYSEWRAVWGPEFSDRYCKCFCTVKYQCIWKNGNGPDNFCQSHDSHALWLVSVSCKLYHGSSPPYLRYPGDILGISPDLEHQLCDFPISVFAWKMGIRIWERK